MKLLYCPQCHDIVALYQEKRSCLCGLSSGKYLDDRVTVKIDGAAIVLGFSNSEFFAAVRNQPEYGLGHEFLAFVLPKSTEVVKKS